MIDLHGLFEKHRRTLSVAGMIVLVGPEGECYHGNANCRGVKRTVHRVRLSEVGGIPPCSRCGK